MRNYLFYCFLGFSMVCSAQNFESFFVGNATNIETVPSFGICLMGGASEDDNAMQWFLNKANGGDVIVIRTSGGDGYNDYFYSDLGVSLNSVETLLINNIAGALDPYVLDKVANAEAIWFAGGNQATYVNYFKDNDFMDLLNDHINVKQAPIGGTSAGMAIMGEFYFDAINGSVTSAEALDNPFDDTVSIGEGSFLEVPFLKSTITDTHYDSPDRKGRHIAFLSRIVDETGERAFGIAAEEFVGICIDETGTASVYGEFPEFDDYAYFLQVNCVENFTPEELNSETPLTWNLNNEAIKTYKIPGTTSGANTFDINEWETGNGGDWEHWWVENGSLQIETAGTPIDCEPLSAVDFKKLNLSIYPNPFTNTLYIDYPDELMLTSIKVFNLQGKQQLDFTTFETDILQIEDLSQGMYIFVITSNQGTATEIMIKK